MSEAMEEALRGLGADYQPEQAPEISTGVDAVIELHREFGAKASGILAQAFGVTQRTGQRWISWAEGRLSQKSNPLLRHPERTQALVTLMRERREDKIRILRNRRAAQKLRAARRIKVGKVKVWDKSPKKGRPQGRMDPRPRTIGTRPVQGVLATARDAAAELVAQGDYQRAAVVLDNGILEAYGVDPETLAIESHLSPPEFEM